MGHRWLIGTIVTLNLCATAISADPVVRRTGAPWPDTLLARVEALALIETLNAKLLGAHTATEVLDTWCADHKMAGNPLVHAQARHRVEKPLSDEQRQRLQLEPAEHVAYRRVELPCGDHVLVEADNWYVPDRLSRKINDILTTTDTPFGRAVRDLKPIRENFSVEMLWKPLPDGWELGQIRPTDPRRHWPCPGGCSSIEPWSTMRRMNLSPRSARFTPGKSWLLDRLRPSSASKKRPSLIRPLPLIVLPYDFIRKLRMFFTMMP